MPLPTNIRTFTQSEVFLSREKPISCEPVHLKVNVPPHQHEFTEVAILQQGSVLHTTPDGNRLLVPGTAIVCPRGTVHGFRKPDKCHLINLYFIDEWLAGFAPRLLEEKSFGQLFLPPYIPALFNRSPVIVSLSKPAQQNIHAEASDLFLELKEATPDLFCLRLSLLKILAVVCKNFRLAQPPQQNPPIRHEINKAFELMDGLIAQGKPNDIATLARQVGLSADHFTKIFQHAVGLRPCEYASRRRIDLAAAALLNTDKTITEIALELGYHDAAHFTHSFRRLKGVTPKAFRKNFTSR